MPPAWRISACFSIGTAARAAVPVTLALVISRYHLKCHGCDELFVVRLGVEPTKRTRFYIPCPHCDLTIRGSMSGTELENHQIVIDCDVVNGSSPDLPGAPIVTVNPFVPSLYGADSFSPTGAFPTMTLVGILGDENFMAFESERHRALVTGRAMWPHVRTLFEYYLRGNSRMLVRTATNQFGLDWVPTTRHEETSIAYHALHSATSLITGRTGTTRSRVQPFRAEAHGRD